MASEPDFTKNRAPGDCVANCTVCYPETYEAKLKQGYWEQQTQQRLNDLKEDAWRIQ